ncbi:MAG: LysM peptidoglycan-binding domain-containing protein, partial [Burkholderiales bacterium]
MPASAVENGGLSQTAPARYTVVEGDTLWSIAGQYLKEPWRWPELWGMNRERSSSPHRLHPGDVLALDRSGPEPRLQLVSALETVRLSPKIRSEPLEKRAVPSISPAAIEPFLSRPLVVARDELDSAARIVATEENRVVVGAGNLAYARGIGKDQGEVWQIFRRGDALVDPDSRETLGFEAIYLG